MKHPFPFIGSGEATNFEWCYLFIKFKAAPDQEAIDQISKDSPLPIAVSRESFQGVMMHATSNSYVNREIQSGYGDNDIPEGESVEYYSSEEARRKFEQHIDQWLLETHSICPIEFVFRPEDNDAQGTKLSDWHYESLTWLKELIPQWGDDLIKMKSAAERSFLHQMLCGLEGNVTTMQEELRKRLEKDFYN
jgi:hypothetical protein